MNYEITIQVDNIRAMKAYQKGNDDINFHWLALEQIALQSDEYAKCLVQAKIDMQIKIEEENKKNMDKYRHMEIVWNEWSRSNSFFRGKEPERPPFFYDRYFSNRGCYPSYIPSKHKELLSIKDRLSRKLALASAATAPFNMKENDVHWMLRWETDENIEALFINMKWTKYL